ncbi:reduced folate carrier [Ancylostoma caninum]|uniref:Reduced folate carrier n=1 Tax=Ancylostoma caninum TaxID=29170 RepID=A0A368GCP7_ANCCA|nr:reduced folate carrier [Ancylostoma caninum]
MASASPKWIVTTILLCSYGFLKEFRPTEPFLYQYEHETLNISEHTLNAEVKFTEIECIFHSKIHLLVAFSRDQNENSKLFQCYLICLWFQILEFFYGWATATEIAYFAYIYVNVSKDKFKRVTSYTRGALLFGRFLGYSVAQLVILMKWGTYQTLNIISLGALCIALIFAVVLPSISWKNAYEKKLCSIGPKLSEVYSSRSSYKDFARLHFKMLVNDIKRIYGNKFMMKWSLWWALASCGFFQIGNYTQTLWGTIIEAKNTEVYNGVTEALCPLIGLPIVILVQYLRVDWSRWGELCLAACSLLDALVLLLLARTNSLLIMYLGYVVYRVLYQAMITITQFNLADSLETASYGLVFGLNTFIALVLQSILTLVVTSSFGLALSIRPQFEVYSGCHFVVAAIFIAPPIYRCCRKCFTTREK